MTNALPFGFRPALEPAANGLPWPAIGFLVLLLVLGLGYWWWQRRSQPTQPAPVVAEDAWGMLARTLGQADWYDLLADRLKWLGPAPATPQTFETRLRTAAQRDQSGAWSRLHRHWEWATCAGYAGTIDQQAADLATAKRGWP